MRKINDIVIILLIFTYLMLNMYLFNCYIFLFFHALLIVSCFTSYTSPLTLFLLNCCKRRYKTSKEVDRINSIKKEIISNYDRDFVDVDIYIAESNSINLYSVNKYIIIPNILLLTLTDKQIVSLVVSEYIRIKKHVSYLRSVVMISSIIFIVPLLLVKFCCIISNMCSSRGSIISFIADSIIDCIGLLLLIFNVVSIPLRKMNDSYVDRMVSKTNYIIFFIESLYLLKEMSAQQKITFFEKMKCNSKNINNRIRFLEYLAERFKKTVMEN